MKAEYQNAYSWFPGLLCLCHSDSGSCSSDLSAPGIKDQHRHTGGYRLFRHRIRVWGHTDDDWDPPNVTPHLVPRVQCQRGSGLRIQATLPQSSRGEPKVKTLELFQLTLLLRLGVFIMIWGLFFLRVGDVKAQNDFEGGGGICVKISGNQRSRHWGYSSKNYTEAWSANYYTPLLTVCRGIQ